MLFFLFMLLAPRRSTLFPYTTLFRSIILSVAACRDSAPSMSCSAYPNCDTDRKSTRLNSSHVEISYSVFCLKKKNYLRCFMFGAIAGCIDSAVAGGVMLVSFGGVEND